MIYLPNKGKCGRMLIGFLPNKENIREARANPMHFHSLGKLASEEPSESGKTVCTLHLRKLLPTEMTSGPAPATRSEAPTRIVRRWKVSPPALEAEGAKLQGSEESDGGTGRWIGDQLRWN